MNKLKVIYPTKGKAKEYAKYGLSIYKGCSFGCSYCSVPKTLKIDSEDFKSNITDRGSLFLSKLESDCEKISSIDSNIDLLISFTSDPYNDLNEEINLTRKVILILNKYNIPFTILSKGGLRVVKDFDLYKSTDTFATTLTFLDETKLKIWEPSAPGTLERIESLKIAKSKGINTWVSLEPVIDPVETLKLIDETYKYVSLYKIGKINYNKEVEDSVDWKKFVKEVEEKLKKYEVNYILKEGLLIFKD